MIRIMKDGDLTSVIQIWLDANIRAHSFVPEEYWTGNYEMVKEALGKAELYVYEEDDTNEKEFFMIWQKQRVAESGQTCGGER